MPNGNRKKSWILHYQYINTYMYIERSPVHELPGDIDFDAIYLLSAKHRHSKPTLAFFILDTNLTARGRRKNYLTAHIYTS